MNSDADARRSPIPPNIAKAIYARVVKKQPAQKIGWVIFLFTVLNIRTKLAILNATLNMHLPSVRAGVMGY